MQRLRSDPSFDSYCILVSTGVEDALRCAAFRLLTFCLGHTACPLPLSCLWEGAPNHSRTLAQDRGRALELVATTALQASHQQATFLGLTTQLLHTQPRWADELYIPSTTQINFSRHTYYYPSTTLKVNSYQGCCIIPGLAPVSWCTFAS